MLDDLRTLVAAGLHVDNVQTIIRHCNRILKSGGLVNPTAALAIKGAVFPLLDVDGGAYDASELDVLDAQLQEAIIEVIDAAGNRQLAFLKALGRLAAVTAQRLEHLR